jgi:hypothetical protein
MSARLQNESKREIMAELSKVVNSPPKIREAPIFQTARNAPRFF